MAEQAGKNYTDAEEYERNELANLSNTADEIIGNVTGGNVTIPDIPEIPTIDINTLKAGDYIKYDSGKNGVITCRVLYPANSEYGLQIISDKNVKNVTLGSKVYKESALSYNKAIETLNNEAENYINIEYAYDARGVGSAPTVEKGMFIDKDKVKFERTNQYIIPSDANYYKRPFANSNYINSYNADINYETDKKQMETAGIWKTGENYLLASRYVYVDPYNCDFHVRNVTSTGALHREALCYVNDDGAANGRSYECGFRPCISLKSDIIKITTGDGKSADTAYVIEK